MSATAQMRNVQLYFAKLTGCFLNEAGIGFDQTSLAKAILTSKASPHIHLKFRRVHSHPFIGMPPLLSDAAPGGPPCDVAVWMYAMGPLAIEIHYVRSIGRYVRLPDGWHPHSGSNRFIISKLLA